MLFEYCLNPSEECADLVRSVVYIVLPMLLILAGSSSSSVQASQDFHVYRMQQYDLFTSGNGGGGAGTHFGSRATAFSMDAARGTTTTSGSPSAVSRRCVLVHLDEFTLERYRSLVANYVGAIVVILPRHYTAAHRAAVSSLEVNLLHEEVKIPVYFVLDSPEIDSHYSYIDSSGEKAADVSAFQLLADAVLSNGFQLVVNAAQPRPLSPSDYQALNLQGKLNGATITTTTRESSTSQDEPPPRVSTGKIPTVVIVAHYDAFGLATSLSYGCDSNGSGVVALLELSRILSYLYSDSKTLPALNLVFLLTTQGKFNYYGLKKWIDEQAARSEALGKIDLDDIEFAICLDSIGRTNDAGETGFYMHFSKPPKEGQASYEFLKSLEKVSNRSEGRFRFETVHKKINLASEQLAWEHEKFSLNKISAFTLSHYQSYRNAERATMTDTIDTVDQKVLIQNIKSLSQAIIQYMYKNDDDIPENLLNGDLQVSDEFVSSWLHHICSVPRSASLLNKNHALVNNLYAHFNHYLHESVKLPVKIQTKEAEFTFYNEEQSTLVIYNVKPAPFDLFLSILITGYVGVVYLFVVNFGKIFLLLNRTLSCLKSTNQNGTGQQKMKSN